MTDHTPVETEVRAALRDLVPDDLDVDAFRSRLAAAIAGGSASTAADDADPGQTELPDRPANLIPITGVPRTSSRRTRLALTASVAALAAAIAGVLVAVLPGASHHRAPSDTTTTPSAIKPLLLPGTIVLGTYRGHGSQSFPITHRTLPKYTGYSVFGTCVGRGSITIDQQTISGPCTAGGAFGTGGAVDNDRLTVTATASTSWVLTLTITPDGRTNASIQSPIYDDLKPLKAGHGAPPGRADGHGTKTVMLGQPDLAAPYRIELVCHGTGVTIPALRDRDSKTELSTKTCFAGQMYVWDVLTRSVPAHLKIEASPSTTWTVLLTN